jgi:hypothetical protein
VKFCILSFFILLNSYAIVGGNESYETSKYVKLQFVKFGYYQGGPCSGSIISDYAILTAGHCVKDFLEQRDFGLKIAINDNNYSISDIKVPANYRKYQDIYDATYSKGLDYTDAMINVAKVDIAIIKTKRKLKQFKKTKISFMNPFSQVNFCGYGYTFFNGELFSYIPGSEGKLYCGSNKLVSTLGNPFKVKGNLYQAFYGSSLTGAGDSGAALINSFKQQIGVLSGITRDKYGDAFSYFVPLKNNKQFIQNNL